MVMVCDDLRETVPAMGKEKIMTKNHDLSQSPRSLGASSAPSRFPMERGI